MSLLACCIAAVLAITLGPGIAYVVARTAAGRRRETRMNGHDPYACLRDVLERLPMLPARRICELLPHEWTGSHIGS